MTEVRVVLDTTALIAYATLKGVAAAELVMMIEEDEGQSLVGIPAACYMAAHAQLDGLDQQRLEVLATRIDGMTVVLPLSGSDAIEAARLGHTMGHAVIEADRHGARLATYAPQEALRHLPGWRVLDLGDDY